MLWDRVRASHTQGCRRGSLVGTGLDLQNEGRETVAEIHDEPDGITANSASLSSLIAEAYGFSLVPLSDQQLVGAADWAKTKLFDVHAKVDSANVEKDLNAGREARLLCADDILHVAHVALTRDMPPACHVAATAL